METDLSHIFDRFARWGIPVNMMENSALHFSVSIDRNEKLPSLLEELGTDYEVRYNTGLELLTVRHYREEDLQQHIEGRTIFLEQRTRQMARFLISE
jgi:aspartate kinase